MIAEHEEIVCNFGVDLNLKWTQEVKGIMLNSEINDYMCVDQEHNTYVAKGELVDSTGFDIVVTKIDAEGSISWEKSDAVTKHRDEVGKVY